MFSQRYKEFIREEDGCLVDDICGEIDFFTRREIVNILLEFCEPISLPDRYSSYENKTDAFTQAVNLFNQKKGVNLIFAPSIKYGVLGDEPKDELASIFTPYLFDIIELQYSVLSKDEKIEFASKVNKIFNENDIPWLISDGRMVKIDSKQFEIDVKRKNLESLKELSDCNPVFKSAYSEFQKAIEFLEKGNYSEAISNAAKCYESVMKVFVGENKKVAGKLAEKIVEKLDLPQSINKTGFKENVLMSVPYIRNNTHAAHGAGKVDVVINKSLANLSINLTASLCAYLVDEYKGFK